MASRTREEIVVICEDHEARYPTESPFHPDVFFPEYPFKKYKLTYQKNKVYTLFREMLYLLGLDKEHYNSESWNPLGEIIQPGDHVVIKPNFVFHNQLSNSVITHGSVLRAIVDYVFIATGLTGKIIISDTPLASADFQRILAITGVNNITNLYQDIFGFQINVLDLRPLWLRLKKGAIVNHEELIGDPLGSTIIDLGERSELTPIAQDYKKYRVLNFPEEEMAIHQNLNKHEYCIANSILDADVFINVPKLKTHIKAGVTLSLKNAIGINVRKEFLPHHRAGSPEEGGDEYPIGGLFKRLESTVYDFLSDKSFLRKAIYPFGKNIRELVIRYKTANKSKFQFSPYEIRAGAWYGNNTLWRTILDLNKILFYADKSGRMCQKRQRRYFTIVDGIMAGEGAGPLEPEHVHCGIFVGGFNPITVDIVCSKLMGFDYNKIPHLANALRLVNYPLGVLTPGDIVVRSNNDRRVNLFNNLSSRRFKAPPGWEGHIELT